MKIPSFTLLLAAIASFALAQNAPSQPLLPPGVQQMLNTPVWYLNYQVTIRSHGSYPLKWGDDNPRAPAPVER
jgi:hypothetical protein